MKKIESIPVEQNVVGIDVAKEELKIFVDGPSERPLLCPNKPKELKRLARDLKKINPAVIVLEATGGYETAAAVAFSEADLPFAIVFPRRVRQFALGLGMNAKTDDIDARVIAYYGRMAGIKPVPLKSKELRELEALTNRRSQLIEMRLAEQNRLDTAFPSAKKSIQHHIRFLERQIKDAETEIRSRIKESETWSQADKLLQSVPGVGPTLSSTLITDLPELGILSSRRIAALVGVAPFARDTGNFSGKRFIKGGRNSVRRVLYMATIAATRFNPVIKQHYENLCNNGKRKKVALIACARKLLVTLNAIIKNNRAWQIYSEPAQV
jgi:transposase